VEDLIGKNILSIRSPEDQESFLKSLDNFKPNSVQTGVFSATDPNGRRLSANVFTRSISNNGISIDEFQTTGSDCTDSVNYNQTIEQLFETFADESLEYKDKLQKILEVGLNYFELDTAVISSIIGQSYEVLSVAGKNLQKLQPGSQLDLENTLCSTFFESEPSLVLNDISNSKLKNTHCHKVSEMESFVGAAIHTKHGPFGTVNFSSSQARSRPFSPEDENLALLMGTWVGLMVGNKEQLEFISDQSEYYKDLYYSIPAMMFLSDADGLIMSASDRLSEKLELDADNVSGKNCYDLFSVNDEQALKKAIDNGDVEHLPLIFSLPNGTRLELELSSRIKQVGLLKGVRSVVLTDVSERNAALRTTTEQNQRLESANENLNQFAFIASHDLQEPLRKIQQFSSFLQEDLGETLTGDAKYHLGVVVDASERMSTLIYDLLRYSGASQEEPKIESVSLHNLIQTVQQDLELLITESNAVIEVGTLPVVQGDIALLRQMFVNLIGNSIKYQSPERKPKITVTSTEDGLVVADNGIGFPEEFKNKIFDPFTRLHSDKEFKGNGIGLAICTTVCAKHHWTITAEGEPNKGAKFIITFNNEK